MHQPRPYGLYGQLHGEEDVAAVDALVRRLTNLKHAGSLASIKLVRDLPSGGGAEDAGWRFGRGGIQGGIIQAGGTAPLRQRGIARDQIVQRHARATQHHRKAGGCAIGFDPHAGAAQGGHDAGGAKGLGHADHGDVQRLAQGLADGDGATEMAVEVFGLPAAEDGGAVLDQGFGVDQPVIEADGVDKGFQRRSGRADGAGHVDKASARGVAKIGGTDLGQDLAGGVIGEDGGG